MPETKKASCLFCSLQCGFAMETDAGVPVKIDFDTDARQNKGSLCVRGHYNQELLLHPKRFLAATINRRRVPWTTAVTKVAGGISEIKGGHGGDALGMIVGTELSNEDYDAAVAFARDVLGTKNIAVAYDGNDYPFLMGGGAGDASPEDLDDAHCFVLVGDVFWGHPCVAKRVIEARHAARSNRIFTINPFRTNTDWFADRHIACRPGAEPLVLAGLLTAMNARDIPKVDLERAAEAAGLTGAELTAIANDIKRQERVVVLASSRLGDSAAWYLTGVLAAKLAQAAGGKYGPLFRGGNAVGAFERVGSERTVPGLLGDLEGKKIKGLLVFGPDLLQLYPGALAADDLEGLGLLVASSIFENDTTKHSDVALPQAVWTEFAGSYAASFGIATSIEPMVAPQGEAVSVAAMLGAVAVELGTKLQVAGAKAEHPPLDVDVERVLSGMGAAAVGDRLELDLVEGIHPLHRWDGTITGRMSFAQSQTPYCEIWMAPGAAAELDVEQGASVALSTDRGETRIIATVTDRMPTELVAIPSYVPDARGLMVWTPNAGTRWYDVSASGAKVTAEG
jgi:anaerobic selenocysteine-containing dehydrogenase